MFFGYWYGVRFFLVNLVGKVRIFIRKLKEFCVNKVKVRFCFLVYF